MIQDDQQLVQQILSGKSAASKRLYERHETYWFRLCLRYGRIRSEAQDIFQEGVIKVFRGLERFDAAKGSFQAWSNRVMVNEALKYLQKNQWQQSFEDLEAADAEPDISENILGKITVKELIEIVQQLPAGYRVIFNMYEIEGYSHREIAEAMNISIGTSKSQLSRAKKILQQKIKILF